MFLMTILVCASIACNIDNAIDIIRPQQTFSSAMECQRAALMGMAQIRELLADKENTFPVVSCVKGRDT